MGSDFLKTDQPDFWTREIFRTQQISEIENHIIRSSLLNDWEQILEGCEMLLNFQMEVMKYKPSEGGPTLYGMDTPMYKEAQAVINELRNRWNAINRTSSDPTVQTNIRRDREELKNQIRTLRAHLWHLNTVLGLNYQKANDPRKAALQ
jgi:DNA repair exonuclease SbcCD ATPase subunit